MTKGRGGAHLSSRYLGWTRPQVSRPDRRMVDSRGRRPQDCILGHSQPSPFGKLRAGSSGLIAQLRHADLFSSECSPGPPPAGGQWMIQRVRNAGNNVETESR